MSVFARRELRALLVYPTGHFFNTPTVPAAALALADQGWDVEVLLVRNTAAPTGHLEHPRVRLRYFPVELSTAVEPVAVLTAAFAVWALPRIVSHDGAVLAVGIRGLFVVAPIARLLRRRFAYHSLEIYTGERFSRGWARMFKMLDRWCTARADVIVIQDRARAQLLTAAQGGQLGDVVRFPNAPVPAAPRDAMQAASPPLLARARREKQAGRRVISYAGSIAPWGNVAAISEMAERLPPAWTLFVQSRMAVAQSDRDLLDSERLAVGYEPLSLEDYYEFVDTSDVGLAWYDTADPNLRYVGLSSGKIAQYWHAGRPVIVNRIPLYEEACVEFHCGVVVDDASEIPAALARIAADYDRFASGARRAYAALFPMHEHAHELSEGMQRIVGARRR